MPPRAAPRVWYDRFTLKHAPGCLAVTMRPSREKGQACFGRFDMGALLHKAFPKSHQAGRPSWQRDFSQKIFRINIVKSTT